MVPIINIIFNEKIANLMIQFNLMNRLYVIKSYI